MEFSPQMEHASTGDDNATKRKAPTAGLEGSATKMKGQYGCSNSMGEETAYEQEPSDKAAAGLSEVTVVADETMEQNDVIDLEKSKAEYAQLMDELFGNGPNTAPVRWVKHPSFMYYHGHDAEKEDEDLGVVVDGIPPESSK
jgi:hypothetical protein